VYLNIYFYPGLYSPHKEPTEGGKLEVREKNDKNILTDLGGGENRRCETGLKWLRVVSNGGQG
jgi:hypothetical protein